MPKPTAQNERIKRRYLIYYREAMSRSPATVDAAAAAIDAFLEHAGHQDLKRFTIEQARAFKRHLESDSGGGRRRSSATIYSTLMAVRNFFRWLADQDGYRSRITYSDAAHFNPSNRDSRIAKAHRPRPVPTLEQMRHMLARMPYGTAIERRDRALVALMMLTGARDGAVASLRIKHADMRANCLHQDAREVRTKRDKTFQTWFFPIGDDVRAIVDEWVRERTEVTLWGPDDPLFPATCVARVPGRGFAAVGLDRRCWADAGPIRTIFRTACARAGLPYFNPHSLRAMLTDLAQKRCRTPEEYKAWSQNLGHDGVLTTFNSYGTVAPERQAEIIRRLDEPPARNDPQAVSEEAVRRVLRALAIEAPAGSNEDDAGVRR